MKNKLYPCKSCGTQVKIRSKGLCSFCRYKEKGSPLKRYVLKQSAKNKRKKAIKREILAVFYEFHAENVKKSPYCDNCGARIQGNLNNFAHILPKRSFGGNPEVMDELNNCLYLCASINGNGEIGCHNRFDRIQGSSQVYLMECFPKAVEKYLTFKEKVIKYTKYVSVFEDWLKENE